MPHRPNDRGKEVHTSSNELEGLGLSLLVGHSYRCLQFLSGVVFLGLRLRREQLVMVCRRMEAEMMVVVCFDALGKKVG